MQRTISSTKQKLRSVLTLHETLCVVTMLYHLSVLGSQHFSAVAYQKLVVEFYCCIPNQDQCLELNTMANCKLCVFIPSPRPVFCHLSTEHWV